MRNYNGVRLGYYIESMYMYSTFMREIIYFQKKTELSVK